MENKIAFETRLSPESLLKVHRWSDKNDHLNLVKSYKALWESFNAWGCTVNTMDKIEHPIHTIDRVWGIGPHRKDFDAHGACNDVPGLMAGALNIMGRFIMEIMKKQGEW